MLEKLIAWLNNSQPGERVIYHAGSLQYDRYSSDAIYEIGRLMWLAMEDRKVYLVQRKVSSRAFQYVAIKRAPPYAKRVNYDRRCKEWA